MKDIKANIKTECYACELGCINCGHYQYVGNQSKGEHNLTIDFDEEKFVLEDQKCEKCGCNTFNICAFINVNIEV